MALTDRIVLLEKKIKELQEAEILLAKLKAVSSIQEGTLVDTKRKRDKEYTRGVCIGMEKTDSGCTYCVLIRDGIKSTTRRVTENEILPVLRQDNATVDAGGSGRDYDV